jgi:hypothetical protein
MPDKTDPKVSIELGGKQRSFLFSMSANKRFHLATGKNLLEEKYLMALVNKLKDGIYDDDISVIIWACLAHGEDENLTLAEVEEMLLPKNIEEAGIKAFKAIQLAMPEPEDKPRRPLAKSPRKPRHG